MKEEDRGKQKNGNSGDTILNSVTATVTKPVSVHGNGDVLKPKDVRLKQD